MTTATFVNYYEILEISQTASAEQIREAVKRQRRTWVKRQQAPSLERQREAEDRVRQIDAAELALLDPDSRKTFNEALASYVPPTPGTQPTVEGMDWLSRARDFLARGDAQSAIYAARQATDNRASHHEAWALRGLASFMAGHDQDAIFEISEALRLKPDSDEYQFDLGSVYESKGMDKSALQCYERAAQLAPGKPLYQVAIAGIYLDNNLPDKALPVLEKVHSAHPDVNEFTFYLAAALNEATLKSWTSVGPVKVITKQQQIAPSRANLERAAKLTFADKSMRETIASNLRLVNEAEQRRFRMPGFTAGRKKAIRSGAIGQNATATVARGLYGAGYAVAFVYFVPICVIAIAFAINPGVGVVAILAGIALMVYLSWRPGWKWNEIEAKGMRVTELRLAGQHAHAPKK